MRRPYARSARVARKVYLPVLVDEAYEQPRAASRLGRASWSQSSISVAQPDQGAGPVRAEVQLGDGRARKSSRESTAAIPQERSGRFETGARMAALVLEDRRALRRPLARGGGRARPVVEAHVDRHDPRRPDGRLPTRQRAACISRRSLVSPYAARWAIGSGPEHGVAGRGRRILRPGGAISGSVLAADGQRRWTAGWSRLADGAEDLSGDAGRLAPSARLPQPRRVRRGRF